jgi:Zn finger protein HypA/HybF involved in hydrogenase expression
MKSGSTEAFECADCVTEFKLTLEPKDRKGEEESKIVTACPFCGSQSGQVTITDSGLPDGDNEEDEDDEDS